MTDLQRRALLAIETLRERVRQLEGAGAGFAIVGYAVRFPGTRDAEEFWRVLEDGRDAVSEVPDDRWDAEEFYDSDPDARGKMVTRRAGFIKDVGGFDASFFGITAREAVYMDPQHRLLLETSWRAIEHSGSAPADLAGTKTGVYMGLSTHDYLGMLSDQLTHAEVEAYLGTGTSPAAGVGRISYRLGLQGPAVAVDTACSSSLVAVHQACQALRAGECDLALAGGVNVLLSPATMINFSRARMLAPDGRCKTFDAAADGYVRGEGCGVIVVKRLDDAIRDGDRIRAVIRGSAVNQDGASGGLTVPNGGAQQRVIADALQRAGIDPRDVDYLEAHGTGTSLGDPIEVQAAGAVYGAGRDPDRPLLIGSVKTNIGHLEAASGIAGLMKVVLSLEHGVLPKHLHFQMPSPHIPWEKLPVRVVSDAVPWARTDHPRLAGVSSFGFSGTNAHVLLQEAPQPIADAKALPERDSGRHRVLPLSARTPEALAELAVRYRDWLATNPDATLADVCLTAGTARSHFAHRAGLVVGSRADAEDLLDALADNRPAPGLIRGVCSDPPKTAWLFPGQGSQYVGMARELFDTESVFAATMVRCAEVTEDVLDRPLLDVIFGDGEEQLLRHTSYAQPAIYAVEMGLARLWQSWGMEPDVVLGHSVGQYSAACVAGMLGLEDGAALIAQRGRLFGSLPDGGRMAAIFAPADVVESCADQFPPLSIAAYNGANTVLSGPVGDIERALAVLGADGTRCDWLDTSHAFHSALLEPVLDDFQDFADRLEYASPQRTLVCNRTGAVLGRNTRVDGAYWRRHARQPVEFAKGVRTLADLGCAVLLEVGPQPVLTAAALRTWPESATAPQTIASLRRTGADDRHVSEAQAQSYVAGHRPRWAASSHAAGRKVDLPTYPFQHRSYWFTTTTDKKPAAVAPSTATVRLLEDGSFDELAVLLDPGSLDVASDSVGKVLKRLAAVHKRQLSARSVGDARYEIRWQECAAPDPVPDANWLLVTDEAPAGLTEALAAAGGRCRVLPMSGADTDVVELESVLKEATAEDPALRVLVLADAGYAMSAQELRRVQDRVLAMAMRLVRAVIGAELRTPIWLVTQGAQQVIDSDTVSPAQSCLWGFGRAAALEHPAIICGLADVASGDSQEWSRLLSHVVAAPKEEDQFAVRGGSVYVPRLRRRAERQRPERLEVRGDRTYLITGGLGALGLEIAEHLAAHGAGTLVLVSRRPPSDLAQSRIDVLVHAHGCRVEAMTADVSVRGDVDAMLDAVAAELPALAGVVHAAGEIGSTPLEVMDASELDRIFSGKVWGAWHLTEATAGLALDFFVTTSSIAAVWGSFGQTAYAAANAFLDGLACWQRTHGIAGSSVDFGLLSAGMADAHAREQLNKRGVETLSSPDALAGWTDVVTASDATGIVARIDWSRFLPIYHLQRRPAFFAEFEELLPQPAAPQSHSGSTELVEHLTAAPVEQRRSLVLDYLRRAVADVTRIDPAEIRDETGFFELGMDSLMAMELRQRLEQGTGRPIPVTLAMDHPRLSDAADYVLSEVLGLADRKAVEPDAAVPVRNDDPIAIVAVACRFPGAHDAEAFWELLAGGVDAISEVPEDRYDINEFYDPDPDAPGKIYTRFGGYLDRIDGFDPEFFGISPREAVWIDPQQRMMLETAWEGLERAGYSPAALRGSRSGVYLGVGANEYSHLLSAGSMESIDAHFITGNALNVIAGRVAFALGLEGPAVAMDTACSSSLVAVHQACQALHAGDCDLALAGGVNVLLSPATSVATSRARMLSPDGRCKTFDAAADGYVRGEGCGVLVLKRLSDAIRDDDQIRAVIRGSAVNQDGASGGLTVPNGGAQQRVIATALARAGFAGGDVDYLEAHGTGTSLGDPIEVQAAAAAFGVDREPGRPLLMGSVKTNIGHLEAASGIAGLIKVVLSLEHETLPQHLNFRTPSPHIPWDRLPVQVVGEPTPWRTCGRPRRAGVSSFGFSGTNAHVLVEEPPALAEATDDTLHTTGSGAVAVVLPLSARSPEALVALAHRYQDWLVAHSDADIGEVAFSAGVGRSHFEHRAALVTNSVESAASQLAALTAGGEAPGMFRGVCGDPPKTAWLFTGQGSQYPGMARALFDSTPVFRDTLQRCATATEDLLARPLLDVIFDESNGEALRHTSFAQPALFAVEMGLARMWQAWGIEPDVVLGHSVGQFGAACVAGVLGLEDGARLLAQRGRLFGDLPDGGRMVAVFADAEDIEDLADEFALISVAAYNGANTVLSGPAGELERLVESCREDGMRCEWLDTSHAFHSVLLEPALDEFERVATGFDFAVPTRPLVCNRIGAVVTATTPLDAQYWRKHARQPVQFAESVRTVAAMGVTVLMEIGPQPILCAAALRAWPEATPPATAIASLRKGTDPRRQVADALAAAYAAGHRLRFEAQHSTARQRLQLPTYPFQHRSFWPKAADVHSGTGGGGILGSLQDLSSGDVVYTSRLSVKTQPWLADHVIYGTVVVPGATYAAMALAAVGAPAEVREVFFYEPIILRDRESRELQLTVRPAQKGDGYTFEVHSRPYGDRDALWALNAGGSLAGVAVDAAGGERVVLDGALEKMERTRPQQLFDTFADNELAWGATWCSSLKSLWVGTGEAIGDIAVGAELADHVGAEPMHPVLLDLCTGVAGAALLGSAGAAGVATDLFLPLRYGRVHVGERMPQRFYCRATWRAASVESETQAFDLEFVDRDGRVLGGIEEFTVKRAPREALLRGLGSDSTRLMYRLGWRETQVLQGVSASRGTWLVRGYDELAALLPGGRRVDPQLGCAAADEDLLSQVSGIVWRVDGQPNSPESVEASAIRLKSGIAELLDAVQSLLRLPALTLPAGLWIITERAVASESGEPVDPAQAAIWGLGRSLIAEQPGLRCRLVDHDGSADAVAILLGLLGGEGSDEPEIVLRQGKCLVPRLLSWARSGHLPVPRNGDYVLAPTERGALDNLRLTQTEVPPPGEGQVQVRVQAAGLNFRDVLNVLGLYPGDPGAVGGELAGVVTAVGPGVDQFEIGQGVFGFGPGGAFASRVNVPVQFLAHTPPALGAIAAASAPAAVLTARLAFDWARLGPGDRVLIHAASGGVGLAAVQLAQRCGATVFATASTYKRATLQKMGVEHVYDSRSLDFADQIMADTGGAGVDVVLNSLTNDGFVAATVRATAAGGRFVEIAKRDIWSPEDMAAARPDIDYEILALDGIMQSDPERIRVLMADLAGELATGVLAPLPVEIYPIAEAKSAFRRMQQARHIGKIVLQMTEPLQPRPDRSYLVTGGLGALGLHTAGYLAQLGAGDIVLVGRREPDAETLSAIDELSERYHCRFHTIAADVGDGLAVRELLERIRTDVAPLGGVVHAAGVLDDALVPNLTADRFRTTLAPKAFGAMHLDRLTADDDLEFFVMYSSGSSVLGSPGQANYAAANAFLDGLAADRKARGLPATAVNWGPWAKGGMASSDAARANLGAHGLIPLEPGPALAALGEVIGHGTGQATVLKANWQRAAKLLGGVRPPILDQVLPSAAVITVGDSELLRQLHEVPEAQRGSFIAEHLQRELQQILGLAQPPVTTSRFLELGMDSLMAVELRNRLVRQFGSSFTITATAVFDYPSIGELADYLAGQTPELSDEKLEQAPAAPVATTEPEQLREAVA